MLSLFSHIKKYLTLYYNYIFNINIETCPVCLDNLSFFQYNNFVTECNHKFCKKCINDVYDHATKNFYKFLCPCCRLNLEKPSFIINKKSPTITPYTVSIDDNVNLHLSLISQNYFNTSNGLFVRSYIIEFDGFEVGEIRDQHTDIINSDIN
jgi:hypothetical protein